MKEGVGDHGHQGVSMEPVPRSAFEMVEPEFFLQLLVRLLADPPGLDRGGKRLEAGLRRQI